MRSDSDSRDDRGASRHESPPRDANGFAKCRVEWGETFRKVSAGRWLLGVLAE
jgi:hypothetical protein